MVRLYDAVAHHNRGRNNLKKKKLFKGRDVHRMCAVLPVLRLLTAEINESYPIPLAPSMTQRNTKFFLTDLFFFA